MKKRIFIFACIFSLFIGMFSTQAINADVAITQICPADETIVSETIIDCSDGSSLLIVVSETPSNSSTRATKYSTSGTKTYNLRNSDGDILWQFMVHGTFTFTSSGTTAVCTEASHSYNIVNSAWNNTSASSYKSGNSAIGNAEFKRKLLLITVETRSCEVTLSCDANGNLS